MKKLPALTMLTLLEVLCVYGVARPNQRHPPGKLEPSESSRY